MLESQKLFKQAADLFEQAKTALVKGDNTADDLQKQAEETLSRAEKVKVIEEQQKALTCATSKAHWSRPLIPWVGMLCRWTSQWTSSSA